MVEFYLSGDEVRLHRASPDVTEAVILQALADGGICFGILRDAVAEATRLASLGSEGLSGMVLAVGLASKPGYVPIERLVNAGEVAAPGDVLEILGKAVAGTPGKTVFGKVVLPEVAEAAEAAEAAGASRPSLPSGDNTALVSASKLEATVYGTVEIDESSGATSVRPPVEIDDDRMSATIDLVALSAAGTAITSAMVEQALQLSGVKHGIDVANIESALDAAARQTGSIPAQLMATGTPATDGQDGTCEFSFRSSAAEGSDASPGARAIARRGDELCVREPAVAAVPGSRVTGEPIEPGNTAPREAQEIEAGPHVSLSDDRLHYSCALPAGYPKLSDGVLEVEPPLLLSDRDLYAHLVVHPAASGSAPLSRDDVEALVVEAGVTAEVDWDAALEALGDPGEGRRVLIASGVAPVPGEDGRVDYAVDRAQRVGTERADGSIDFWDRGAIVNLGKGQAICTLVPHTEGTPGRDVHGGVIPTSPGAALTATAGENVVCTDNELSAAIDGVLVIADQTIAVTDMVQVKDVDFQVGNLDSKGSAIRVQGTVKSSFKVRSSTHISVGGTVEDAVLVAGGDVEVKNGILGGGTGFVTAAGSVSVRFAQNARISAGADINVENSAMACELRAGGRVIAMKGKGRLIGGTIWAGNSVEAKELGAFSHVPTEVEIGLGSEEGVAVVAERERLCAALEKKMDAERKELLRGELASVSAKEAELLREARASGVGHVTVRGVIHPGVVIVVYGKTLRFPDEMRNCRVHFEPEEHELVASRLR